VFCCCELTSDFVVSLSFLGQEQAKINTIEEELMRIAQTADEVIAQQYGGGSSNNVTNGRLEKGWYQPQEEASSSRYLVLRQNFLLKLLHESHQKIVGFDEKRRDCEAKIKAIKKIEA
jgi:hypothetical protein